MTAAGSAHEAPRNDAATSSFVEVALKLPLRKTFTYRLAPGALAKVGSRVLVPFRGRAMSGIVTRTEVDATIDPSKIRAVDQVFDDGGVELPESLMRLAERMAVDYGCSLGEALDATVPSSAKRRSVRRIPHLDLAIPRETAVVAVGELEEKHQPRARVLRAVLEFGAPMPLNEIKQRTGTSDSPWKTLVKHGTLRRILVDEEAEPLVPAVEEAAIRHELNAEQQAAVDRVVERVEAREHRAFLLHGVTGSGKTEVYLRILERVRAAGRTAIVLVPEIALTPQTVGRFASRFPDVAVLHSGLTGAERARQWRRLANGDAGIAIGARSALFAPLRDVGLIVLDEEQESSFKQDTTPRYHARELAIARGEIENACVVLGSATPTLESYGRAKRGLFELLTLPERAGAGTQPKIIVEDLRREDKESAVCGVVISRTLRVLMRERLEARDQVILFLNRRGYSPVLICPSCGTPVKCPHCDVTMAWHVRRARLICHYCCHERRRPELCDYCEHPKLHELGAGTERVEAAVQSLFPDAIVARMDADTMNERGAHERVLASFRKRHIDVLIGTQMIAKGLDFPDVTLVGVVSADTGLFLPDFRAAERTFQLLYQVAGRAGRGAKPGTVVFQTLSPENYAIKAAAAIDYEAFVQRELEYRHATAYPPWSRLIRVLLDARKEGEAQSGARRVCDRLGRLDGVDVLGPAPAVLSRVKDRFRYHVVAKCRTPESFRAAMEKLRTIDDLATRSLRVMLDVDPQSLL
ncbi:MAG: primosomal protein N' [Planctomycetes bacterium]|nr:primosomal protein N' [Planctomycetota bacterium]